MCRKKLRNECWIKFFGERSEGYCYCCYRKIFNQEYSRKDDDYECGHIIAYSLNKEYDNLSNLIPLCHICNMNMSSTSADVYALSKGYKSYVILNCMKKLVEKN